MPISATNEAEQSRQISAFETEIESKFNADVVSKAFGDILASSFEEDLEKTKVISDKLAERIDPLCAKSGGVAGGSHVIIANKPEQLASAVRLSGELYFCNRDISVNYIRSMSSEVREKLKGAVQLVSDFDSTRKQSDGHHVNQVNFFHDVTPGQGFAALRLVIRPYTEYQFSDRGEQTFNSRVESDCDLADKAAIEIANTLVVASDATSNQSSSGSASNAATADRPPAAGEAEFHFSWPNNVANHLEATSKLNQAINLMKASDGSAAAQLLEPLAEQKNAVAETLLGQHLLQGAGIVRDRDKARQLLLDAANQNYAPAQYIAGVAYANGALTLEFTHSFDGGVIYVAQAGC